MRKFGLLECFVRKTGTIMTQKFLTNPDADLVRLGLQAVVY